MIIRTPVASFSRRRWLQASATGLTGALLAKQQPAMAIGPHEILRVGVIGVGVRGKYLIANLPTSAKVVALCDCSNRRIESAVNPQGDFRKLLADFAMKSGRYCQRFQDYREMLDRMKLDAVIISAPDHHHAHATIASLKAGCHVYVEKPLAVTIEESRAMVEAAKKYQRIVQVGSQQRSMRVNQIACEFIRDGGLGKIDLVVERNLPGPMPYEAKQFPEQTIPEDLDWEMFCGPTPMRAYHPQLWMKEDFRVGKLLWRGWDLFQDYSGHLLTNWGAHSLDMIQYALGMDESGPSAIEPSLKVSDFFDDDWSAKTPPLETCLNRDADLARFREVSLTYPGGTRLELKNGIERATFYGEKGIMEINRNDYACWPNQLLPRIDSEERRLWDGSGHVARPHLENWIEAIHGREKLRAPLETGHRTVSVCHLINIARQLGERLDWDPQKETFKDQPSANQLLSRPRRKGFDLEV
jgi:predicted dehydrogenase